MSGHHRSRSQSEPRASKNRPPQPQLLVRNSSSSYAPLGVVVVHTAGQKPTGNGIFHHAILVKAVPPASIPIPKRLSKCSNGQNKTLEAPRFNTKGAGFTPRKPCRK